MESILLRDLYQKDHALASSLNGQEITVSGWVRSIRDSKSLGSSYYMMEPVFKRCRSSMNMARCSLIRMDPLPMKGKKPSRP